MGQLFQQIYEHKKVRVNISINEDSKTYLTALSCRTNISISELIESLYRTHRDAVMKLESVRRFPRKKCKQGEPMFETQPMMILPVCLTPPAINFFDVISRLKGLDRSKLIRLAISQIF